MLTGQWGETISTNTGAVVTKTYTYTLPTDINGVELELGNLLVAAFVAETEQEIVTGSEVTPTYVNVSNTADANAIELANLPYLGCSSDASVSPTVSVKNNGGVDITELEFTYDVNGAQATHTWTGSILTFATETIELPALNFTTNNSNELTVTITSVNGGSGNIEVAELNGNMEVADEATTQNIQVVVKTDGYAEEIAWTLKDENGTEVASAQYTSGDNGTEKTHDVTLNANGCFEVEITDTYGDGILSGGFIKVLSGGNEVMYIAGNEYTSSETKNFAYSGPLNVEESVLLNNISLFPNPVSSTG